MKNFRKSISLMIGPKFPFSKWFYFIDVCLYFVTPAILLVTNRICFKYSFVSH